MVVSGTWDTDADIGPDEFEADKPLLVQVLNDLPEGVTIRELEVVIHGRIWRWKKSQ